MQLNYSILDVYTDKPLTGNPLAVVTKADNLNDDQMQAIAREFNLSETVFVRQPRIERHTANVRIFTTRGELPFAGHPTVGTAVLLGLQQRASAVRLEEKIGLITCIMERTGRNSGTARFGLPEMPKEMGPPPSVADVARTLDLSVDEIGFGPFSEPAHFSAGVDYYLVPVRDTEVLSRLKPERRGWNEVYPAGLNAVYAFTETKGEFGIDYAARMLSPSFEDPATGSAAAALIGLLARDPASPHSGQKHCRVRQGREVGRPSRIDIQMGFENGKLVHGGIGGSAVVIGEGRLDI